MAVRRVAILASRRTVIVLEYTSSGPVRHAAGTLLSRCVLGHSGRESQLTCVHPGSNYPRIATLAVCQLGHAAGRRASRIGAYGAAVAAADGMRAQSEASEHDPRRLKRASSFRTRRPAQRTIAPLSVVTRRSRARRRRAVPGSSSSTATSAASGTRPRSCGCARSGGTATRLLLHDRLRLRRRGFGFDAPAPAPAERGRPARALDDRSGRDRRDRRAAHRCGLRPGHRRRLGSDGVRRRIRGRRRRPCRHGENDAQHRESSHRSPPAPQQRPSSLSCHIPPISGPFLEATAVLGACQRGFTPRRPVRSRSAGRRLLSFRA